MIYDISSVSLLCTIFYGRSSDRWIDVVPSSSMCTTSGFLGSFLFWGWSFAESGTHQRRLIMKIHVKHDIWNKLRCSTNYHACIAMSTWCRCAPPILFWPWHPFYLFSRSCLTWISSINLHWGTREAILANYHVCIAIHIRCRCALPILFWPWPLFNLFLIRSCALTCSTSNCGRGTSLLRQELA